MKAWHREQGFHGIVLQCLAECLQIYAAAWIAGDFEYAKAEALQGFEKAKISGSFDRDGVARLGDGAQRQIDRLGAADGDDELVVVERGAGLEISAGDFAGERLVGAVHRIAAEERGVVAHDRAEDAREFPVGKEGGIGAGGTEREKLRVFALGYNRGGEIVVAYVSRPGHRPCHPGLGDLGKQFGAHVVTRLWAGFEEASVFEHRVGLEHRGNAHIPLHSHAPYRWDTMPWAKRALIYKGLQRISEGCVKRSGAGCGVGEGHGEEVLFLKYGSIVWG
ncbi:MAG: hypothetical protein BWX86_01779 [Verrucomicrobia bacterium ADurb.Bin122]|nr:MAG: hypothetical protein BWX86_01779 [Verrucomicrobia bacterium ADurb.Bin122]